tara:strand:+ start:544 stop:1008 length:465 start_codon:yes stop_codon:yes gene_type:complete
MKLIKDLGMQYATNKSKRTCRFGLYECPTCLTHFKSAMDWVNKGRSKGCQSCANSTHREHKTKLYYIWAGMNNRCYNPRNTGYPWYGAKGITVCDEWRKFIPFRDWAKANGYVEGLSIDKDEWCEILNISPKIYSPETCQWVTRGENTKLKYNF